WQGNEPDAEVRVRIEQARLEVMDAELNPLHVAVTERTHELSLALGWESYRKLCEELKAVDLEALERQTRGFSEATAEEYPHKLDPQLRVQAGVDFESLRRSDIPYFFRGRGFDSIFPEERLMEAFEQ